MRGKRRCSLEILLTLALATAARAEEPDHLVRCAAPGFARLLGQELDPSVDLRDQQAWGGVVIGGAVVIWLRSTQTGPEVEIRPRRGHEGEVTVHSQRATVSVATYRALQDAWEAMLQRAREPDDEYLGCDDCSTTYLFFGASDDPDKWLTGLTVATWPLPGRLPGRFVGLAYSLAGFATTSSEARKEFDARLRTAAERLVRDANAHN
jgi:hypothetical protein